MPAVDKLFDHAIRAAGGAVAPRARQLGRSLVVSKPAKQPAAARVSPDPGVGTPASSPAAGNKVSSGSDPTGVTETNVSVLVTAPVLTVCRYLADIANIARGLPGVRSVHAGEDQTLTIRYDRAARRIAWLAPGRFRIDQQRQRVEWEIRASALYSGTLSIHGDCNISRLQSILRSDQRSLGGAAREVHLQMLRRIARAVEEALDLLGAPLGEGDPAPLLPAAEPVSALAVSPQPGHPAMDSAAVLGSQGLVRECWGD